MFGFGKKTDDPKEALAQADQALNKGLTGALVRGFMGKDFQDRMNGSLDAGRQAVQQQELQAALLQTGAPGMADVLAISDTGALVNMNPVVVLTLRVTPSAGDAFDTQGQVIVSKIAIPRVGDRIQVKYDPAQPARFAVL